MGRILEAIGTVLKDATSLILIGMGITFAPHVYFGGLFLALAGAAIARAWEKDQAEKAGHPLPKEGGFRLFLVILTAFFVSTLVAIMVMHFWPNWSVQLVMAVSGFASRKVVVLALSVIESLSHKGDTIANRWIDKAFPPQKKDDNNG